MSRLVHFRTLEHEDVYLVADKVEAIRGRTLPDEVRIETIGDYYLVAGTPGEVARRLGLDWPGNEGAEVEAEPPRSEAERIAEAFRAAGVGTNVRLEDRSGVPRTAATIVSPGGFCGRLPTPAGVLYGVDAAAFGVAAYDFARVLAALGYTLAE